MLYIWDRTSNHSPQIEYFPAKEWEAAIDRARDVSRLPTPMSRIQVVDVWGMLIAQFCPLNVLLSPSEYKKHYG